ncbi:MAG: lipoyl(octanoyl) transferase LipB [Chloroflexota bacterium]
MVAPARESSLVVIDAGWLGYAPALALQERLCRERRLDRIDDHLLLLEHLPVVTLGQSGGAEDLRVSQADLAARGVELFETNRGGRATFHGPGQLVAYPIMRLAELDLHAYLWKLEEALLRLLAEWNIPAGREERYPGVWIDREKIAAIGVAVVGDVTMHGLALNVTTDLASFELITPCGIRGRGVTSMERRLGQAPPMAAVKAALVRHFCQVFDLQVRYGSIPE